MDGTPKPGRYRIEHRERGLSPLVLAHAVDLAGARREAAGWRALLRARNARGRIVVVDDATADEAETESLPIGQD